MIGQTIRIVSITVFSVFVLSCSLKTPEIQIDSSPTTEIQDIRVLEKDGKMVIEVEGEEPMIYTTFHLADPDRLVIDMAGIALGRFSDEILMEKGPIRAIRPATGGGDNVSRLEFLLADSVEADVRTEGFNLVVEVVQSGEIENGFKLFEDEPTAELPAEEVAEGPLGEEEVDSPQLSLEGVEPPPLVPLPPLVGVPDSMEPDLALDELGKEEIEKTLGTQEKAIQEEVVAIEQIEPPIVDMAPLSSAKRVKAVEFVQAEGLQLLVTADGKLSPRVFFVDEKRLVIDLPGVDAGLKQRKIPVSDDRVKQVRIGRHPKKLRLVVDLISPIIYSWEQDRGILRVMLKDPSAQIIPSEIPVENQLEEDTLEPDLPIPEESESTVPLPFPLTVDDETQDEVMQSEEMVALPFPEDETLPALSPPPAISDLDGQDGMFKSEKTDVEEMSALPLPEDEALPAPPPPLSVTAAVEGQEDETIIEPTEVEKEEMLKTEKTDVEEMSKLPLSEEEILPTSPPPLSVTAVIEDQDAETKIGATEAGKEEMLKTEKTDVEEISAFPLSEEEALPTLPPVLPTPIPVDTQPEAEEAALEETKEVEKVEEQKEEKPDKKKAFLKNLREKKAKEDTKIRISEKDQREEAASNKELPKYIGKKISLDFHQADITNVIRLIADVSGLNFVMGDDVKGNVTLKLLNVPWDQGLSIILEMNSLGQVREGNIIRITTLANLTKQRAAEAAAKETKVNAEDLLTRVVYVNYANAGDMKSLLDKLLSPRGEIMVDTRTNALILKDIESNLDGIEKLASRLDTKTPQVLIEARIAEIKPSFLESLGIQWGADFKSTNNGNLIGIGNPEFGSPLNAPIPDFAVNLPSSTNFGGIGFTFGRFTQNPFALDLRLSAGESQSLTRIVSTPKVMVLDNHEALIEQGQSIPFSTVSQDGTQIQFVDASLTLRVTPHISPDGGVLLDVHLSKNEPGIPIGNAVNPPIFKKEVTTNVLLMDGETMVIGGIYETTKIESESGLPWLKDLPVIGWLFKNKTSREDTTELLVFLTPKIMD